MADADRCLSCDSDLPPNAPNGLCPRCLPQQGSGSDAFSLARGGMPAAAMSLACGPGILSVLAQLDDTVGTVPRLLIRDSELATGTGTGSVVKPTSPEMPAPTYPSSRLQLLGEIARGGMGAVLKGRDGDLGRDLAVKVLLEQHGDKPELIRRFIEEAQIAGQLQHPGVVPVYELGAFADRRPYFTMKLVKGRTLADVLGARADPTADRSFVLGVFHQVCQTVAYAHARGVIHRDLKPSNVMVGSFGEVQLMDWGLAKVLGRDGASDDAEAGNVDDQSTIIQTVQSGSDAERSHPGSVMGTPGYMAPEQARGEIDRVDERADVFALGSILCEVLTGQPAFTNRGTREVRQKAAGGDLADAFARLDACGADADLLAVARACLAADREERPRNAGGVALRLSSYLAGVQERLRVAELARAAESARAEEAQARVAVERSRRRRTVALAASLLAMTTFGGLTYTYISHAQQARAAAMERLLGRAHTLLDQARDQPEDPGRWRTALAAVQQVEDDPDGIVPGARDRLVQFKTEASSGLRDAERYATLRQALVDVRANQQDAGADATDEAYAKAFGAAGLDLDSLGLNEAADRLRRRPEAVRVELAAYLDHWSHVRRTARQPPALWRKPLDLARAVDADDYRDRLRALLAADDPKAVVVQLKALADAPKAAELPAPTAVLLAGALQGAGDREAMAGLLRRSAQRHPGDVWVNLGLASVLTQLRPAPREEAVRYYTAARAVRPETAHDLAHLLEGAGRGAEAEAIFRDLVDRRPDDPRHLACLGRWLKDHGRANEARVVLDRAVTAARAALRLNPVDAGAHIKLGNALHDQGKPSEAEAEFRAALELRPDVGWAHINVGNALHDQGKWAEAEAEFRAALKLRPDDARAHSSLGTALSALGKRSDAVAEFRTALQLTPDSARVHFSLGVALWAQGKPAEAEAEYRSALELKPDYAEAHTSLGVALFAQGKRADAVAEYLAALKLKPDYAEAHYNLGNALAVQAKFADAEAEFRAVLRLKSDYAEAHCNLGQLLRRAGRYGDAVEELRRGHELGSRRPGWRYDSARWVREAERMVALDARLPAVLKGDDHPADGAERLVFARLCSERKLHAAATELYKEALRDDPKLGDGRRPLHRYNAACSAALAGCGQGKDNPAPDESARAKLRGQALDWLEGELAAWSRVLDGGKPEFRAAVRQALEHWKIDSDLAGLRDEAGLAKLPAEERPAWRALWKDVETLLKKVRGDRP